MARNWQDVRADAERAELIKPKPRSYSQLRQWSECGMRYRLERIDRIKSRPGVWLPAGTAVHKACEEYLRQSLERAK